MGKTATLLENRQKNGCHDKENKGEGDVGTEQWVAIGALIATIIGSVTSVLFWFSRRHHELSKEIHGIHLDMQKIEAAWSNKMHNEIAIIKKELSNGPPWLRELMDAQRGLLEQALKNAQIAIDVADQHGREMIAINSRIEKLENKQDTVLQLLQRNT